MKALVLSGGGAKGAFTAGVVKYLLRDAPARADSDFQADFKIAVGNSTGSLVGGPALLNEYQYCEHVYTSVRDANIFSQSFIGRLLNFLGIINGPIHADMAPLKEIVYKYYIHEGKLDRLIADDKNFVVAVVNVRTGLVQFVSSADVGAGDIRPETFVNAVVASCCEPVFTKPIRVFEQETAGPFRQYRTDLFYDGGVKEFIPLEKAVLLGADDVWAVSTHRLRDEETTWGGAAEPNHVNMLDALGWTISSLLSEVARGDRFRADLYIRWSRARNSIIEKAKAEGLSDAQAQALVVLNPNDDPTAGLKLDNLRLIYPSTPMQASLEFDPAVMFDYFLQGELAARRFFDHQAPLYTDSTLREWEHYA
jgi:predicted acylesterase/phospholipase RssA